MFLLSLKGEIIYAFIQMVYQQPSREVQLEMVHSIAGMEQARIIRPGYAIEYDL